MVVAGVVPATLSLLLPSKLSLSPISLPNPSSRLRHFSTASSTLLFKNHDCRHFSSIGDGSSLFLIRYPNSNGLSSSHLRRWLKPIGAVESDGSALPDPIHSDISSNAAFKQWDWFSSKFAAGANIPFLLLQLPQILLFLAVSWLGMLTGLLGNLALLSYFAKKRETEAMIVQCLGVFTTYIVVTQLALGQAMPFPYYIATSVVIGTGVISNFLNYFGMLPPSVWHFWEDFITVCGLSVLPQARMGKLSEKGVKFVGAISRWTATLLFMWMPVAQMWTNFLNPENIKGLSALSMLLALLGNGLLIPRALFVRDFMWFKSISPEFFWGVTAGISIWMGVAFWKDSQAYGHGSPIRSLKELVLGSES